LLTNFQYFMRNLSYILTIIDMVIMVALIIAVALQNKSAGLSNVFGGGGNVVTTRRGSDKWLFFSTIILGVLFAGISLAIVLLDK
jgi:protein translocase SecG subunit